MKIKNKTVVFLLLVVVLASIGVWHRFNVRYEKLEGKVAFLEQQLADFFDPGDGMSSRGDSSARMKKKINDAYDKCPYAKGNAPIIPAGCKCTCSCLK